MALRAFYSNPSIGGFGNEGGSGIRGSCPPMGIPKRSKVAGDSNTGTQHDGGKAEESQESGNAFCQIVKELVDNSIDACETDKRALSPAESSAKIHRIKVEILPYDGGRDALQIVVSDNGCGMESIQDCVNAFRSSKNGSHDQQTAGRYGIGLTLSLLHAQRLVPGTYSCITSATKSATSFRRAFFVVNTSGDRVECHREEEVPKSSTTESGTCASVVVPVSAVRIPRLTFVTPLIASSPSKGGPSAAREWSRLVHHLNKFNLSAIRCTIEVLAPTLAASPFHRNIDRDQGSTTSSTNPNYIPGELIEGWDDISSPSSTSDMKTGAKRNSHRIERLFESERKSMLIGARKYKAFSNGLELSNIAFSEHPIRRRNTNAPSKQQTKEVQACPRMSICLVVSPHEEFTTSDSQGASLELVRMVNGAPLLDGPEAFACGLVKALTEEQKRIWAPFGLSIDRVEQSTNSSWSLCFSVKDSAQVAPFYQQSNHQLWSDGKPSTGGVMCDLSERRHRAPVRRLMPAKVRLGKIVAILNISATPESLPLPTLSKGRLPVNQEEITQALQLCLRDCFRSLQTTGDNLLLSPKQLRSVEREVRYIPMMARATIGILSRMRTTSRERLAVEDIRNMAGACGQFSLTNAATLSALESRLSEIVLSHKKECAVSKGRNRKRQRKNRSATEESEKLREFGEFDSDREDSTVQLRGQSSHKTTNLNSSTQSRVNNSWELDSRGSGSTSMTPRFSQGQSDSPARAPIHYEEDGNDDDEWW